jgi:hypothetical protein
MSNNILVGTPVLIKDSNGGLSCSFNVEYTTLPLSIPHIGTSAYSIRVHLQCEDGTFGKLVGEEMRFDSFDDPPPSNILTGTVSLIPPLPMASWLSVNYPPSNTPPYTYAALCLILDEYRTGMLQREEIFDYQTVIWK